MSVVLSGGTKGIGRSILELLSEKGLDIVFCARNQSEVEDTVAEVSERYGNKVFGVAVDLSKKSEIKNFADFIFSQFDTVDVLINNAGIFVPGKILEEDEGTLQKMMDTNLYSAYHLTRLIAPSMIQKKGGHIINMCSIASQIAYPNGGSYSISKFALLGFSKVLREELKEYGVKVTSILPGATWSASWAGVDLPPERLMHPTDIARVVWCALTLGPSAVMEDVVIRPQLGDL